MTKNAQKIVRSEGWCILKNEHSRVIELLVEPEGLAYELAPGDQFYIYVADIEPHTPMFVYKENLIVLFAVTSIVFHNGIEIHNFSGVTVEAPPQET